MYDRNIKLDFDSKDSYFLFGPRGTGKTTWLKQHCQDSFYIDLLQSSYFTELSAQPDRLEKIIPKNNIDYIIVDEVQRIPELLNEVHRLIENNQYRFILTGSSARSLRKRGVNLLAGRALTYYMYPLTVSELGKDFDLQRSLNYGHLPKAVISSSPKKFLKSYINTYLREEVLQEGLVRQLRVFTRFLEVASFSQGALLNMTEIGRELGVDRKTVESYFSILDDLLLGSRLNCFSRRAKRNIVKHSKFYYFDVGVYRAIRPRGPLDDESEMGGVACETLVYQELIACNQYCNYEYSIYFWKTLQGYEVDFVLYGPKKLLAIEVKQSTRVNINDLKGLRAFASEYPEAKAYLFYGGDNVYYEDNITILPLTNALSELPTILGQINQ